LIWQSYRELHCFSAQCIYTLCPYGEILEKIHKIAHNCPLGLVLDFWKAKFKCLSDDFFLSQKFSFLGGLGPNYNICASGPKNTISTETWLTNPEYSIYNCF
jgi:hypothetical protein